MYITCQHILYHYVTIEIIPEPPPNTESNGIYMYTKTTRLVSTDLGGGERMAQGSVGGKGQDGYENRCGGPEVDTESVEVLPPLQTGQLQRSEIY